MASSEGAQYCPPGPQGGQLSSNEEAARSTPDLYPLSARTEHPSSRTRRPHKRPARTLQPAEKAMQAAKRKDKKDVASDMYQRSENSQMELAKEWHGKDPSHTLEYYYNALYHRPNTLKGPRAVSDWSAYCSLRTEDLNDGSLFLASYQNDIYSCFFFTRRCRSFGRTTLKVRSKRAHDHDQRRVGRDDHGREKGGNSGAQEGADSEA